MDIRTLCLGILSLGDATGYEIKKLMAEGSFSFFSEASYGSIYPALTKLTDEGLITCRAESQSKRPDKKIYSLTADGRTQLESALEKTPRPDKNRSEFLAALLFAEEVAPSRISNLLAERINDHQQRITQLEQLLESEDGRMARFVISYGLEVQRAALAFLNKEGSDLTKDKP